MSDSIYNKSAVTSTARHGRWGCGECWACRALTLAEKVCESRPGPVLPEKCWWMEHQLLPNPCSSRGALIAPQYSKESTADNLLVGKNICSSASDWCNEYVVAQEHMAWMTGNNEPKLSLPAYNAEFSKRKIQVVGDKVTSLMWSVLGLGRHSVNSVMSFWSRKREPSRDLV